MTDQQRARAAVIDSLRGLPALVTLDGTARALSVSRRTVERWINLGALESVKLYDAQGGARRVARSEIERFLLERIEK